CGPSGHQPVELVDHPLRTRHSLEEAEFAASKDCGFSALNGWFECGGGGRGGITGDEGCVGVPTVGGRDFDRLCFFLARTRARIGGYSGLTRPLSGDDSY